MWKRWRIRIMLFLAVLGPGFITANVDNDSGGILTYSQAGAQFGYTLLWTMLPITGALIGGHIMDRPAFLEIYIANGLLFYRSVSNVTEEKTDGVLLYSA